MVWNQNLDDLDNVDTFSATFTLLWKTKKKIGPAQT